MFRTFSDAKDRWKIDGATMKGFYLHSETCYLYSWDQARGMLYEFQQSTGQCQAVWSAAVPQLNAEIWTVLPLPPTDPASMQSTAAGDEVPNLDVYIILTVAHEAGRHMPEDVLEFASNDFCDRHELEAGARHKLKKMPAAGRHFAMQNFRKNDGDNSSKAFVAYVDKLMRRPRPPWGSSACTLVVGTSGAIIGRSCHDLNALCRDDPPERLAQAHCKIKAERDRFFVCDLNTAADGTELDGFALTDVWVGPLKTGSLLTVGPLRIKIQLSGMAQDTPWSAESSSSLKRVSSKDEEWQRKVYQKTAEDDKLIAQKRQQEYKDRAEDRRQKNKGEAGSVAVDTLVQKFAKIQEAERAAEEAEERRIDLPTMEAHREANMGIDGSYLGGGGFERAGIGFNSSQGAELIPNVLDPRNLSAQETSKLKTQMRFQQASK